MLTGRTLLTIVGAVALTTVALFAQDFPLVRQHPGVWRPGRQSLAQELTQADRAAAAAWMAQIADVLRGAPALKSPVGFDVVENTNARLDRLDSATARPVVVAGDMRFDLSVYESGPSGIFANDRDAAATVHVMINDLVMITGGTVSDGPVTFGDDRGDFVKGALDPDETLHGYPVYERNNDRWIVITRNRTPIVAPVSRDRYIQFRILQTQTQIQHGEANLATIPKGSPMLAGPIAEVQRALSGWRTSVESLRRQLAAMSPADRARPAFLASDDPFGIPTFADGPDGADPILTLNAALIDPALSRAAPQVLAVSITGDDDHWPGIAANIDAGIDWARLADVVH